MEKYNLTQTGAEVQEILNNAAPKSELTEEVERAQGAEQTLQGNIDAEELRAKAAEQQNADDIDVIEEKIPTEASSSNQLADKAFVNSSIASNTATYRGSFNQVNDLHLTLEATEADIATALASAIDDADNNDYCYIQVPVSESAPTEIAQVDRYKFNGTTWAYEYTLNNSGFTADQWAALNSAITSGLVAKLSALPNMAELTALLAGKQNLLNFDNVPTTGSNNPVTSGGVKTAIDDEKTRAQAAEQANNLLVTQINGKIPSDATSENKLADKAYVDAADATMQSAIDGILALIPEAATALNQLADKAFVNSSIATNTGTFKGTYNVVLDLELFYDATQAQIALMLASKITSAKNNDYCYVQVPNSNETPTSINHTDRYKYNGTAWAYEFTLNNSGFTTAQWAAINSGITELLKNKLVDLPTATELAALLNAKQNTLTFDTAPTPNSTNPVTSDGIHAAINVEKERAEAAEEELDTNKADKATTLAGYGITDAYTKNEVNNMITTPNQQYVTVATYASLPASGSKDTIYRVSNYNGANSQVDNTVYSEYAWNGTQYVFLCVKSQIEEVFDITVYNSNTKYADLAAALGVDGANIPATLRRGGMSVKFVQSSDNKYVQYMYTGTATTGTPNPFVNPNNWEKVNVEDELNLLNATVNNGVATEGKYLNRSNAEVANQDWCYTDYIPYTPGNDVYWKFGVPGEAAVETDRAICFYNVNKSYISNGYWTADGTTGNKTLTSEEIGHDAPNAAYLRASYLKDSNAQIVIGGVVVWNEYGLTERTAKLEDEVKDIEPYIEKVNALEDIVFIDNRTLTTADYYKDSNNWGYYFYNLDLNVGDTAPASPTKYPNSQFGCLRAEVSAGTTVKVYTIGGRESTARAYAVTDMSRKILVIADTNENTLSNPFTYTFTEDGYLYVNCTPANTSSFKVVIERTIQDEIDDSNSRIENLEDVMGDTITRLNVQSTDSGFFNKDGSIRSYETTGISEYVDVEDWETVKTISNAFSAGLGYPFCVFYNSENSDDIVKVVTTPTQNYHPDGVTVQIPSGAKFARFGTAEKTTDLVIELYRNNLDIRFSEIKEPVNEYDSLPVVDPENPIANIVRGAGAAASIMSWGVIGASFESGSYEYYKNGSGTGNMFRNTQMSWPQMFARMNNISMQNFTLPGNTIKMWCNNTTEYGWGDGTQGASKPENKKQAYILVVTENDPYNKDCPIGDVTTDIQEDYTDNADTFCGWLGGAIQRLRSIAPHCMIFVSNVRNVYSQHNEHYQDFIDYNEAIESVIGYFDDVFLLDIFKYGLKGYDPVVDSKYMLVGHSTPMGYLVMAYHYNTLIDSIMRTHQQQFALTAFINSSYESDIDWSRR